MKNNLTDILFFLYNSGMLTAVALFAIKAIKAHTKNQNLLMLATWAQQAITWADNQAGENINLATTFIQKRLAANNLQGRFSDAQIQAVLLKANKTIKEEA
ncbi:hypothetical protein WOSG25_031560 [Weissella oryzae SG25]|uniref:Phage holin n=1 Tax=Weissella oryzae (strain DSM 25784 / JCM 18191 / LMG 30913 / SG25) TaxID=1329250 RepID=A0A069CSV3_WEIOS|nr:hypothetical protein [Weissella oryzae]GAK30559.1 hypothetical protein WOSG25_031560 [Weissella oryzae SG25]